MKKGVRPPARTDASYEGHACAEGVTTEQTHCAERGSAGASPSRAGVSPSHHPAGSLDASLRTRLRTCSAMSPPPNTNVAFVPLRIS